MVGAINPPSIETYQSFRSAAMLVTGAAPEAPVALSGQSAFATAAPEPPSQGNIETTSTSTSSSTAPARSFEPSIPPSSTASAASTTPKKNAIIAGSVVGGVVFLALLVLLTRILLRYYSRGPRRSSKDFFRYRAQTPVLGGPSSNSFNPDLLITSPDAHQALLASPTESTPMSAPSTLTPLTPAHPYSSATPITEHSSTENSTTSPSRPRPLPQLSPPRPPPQLPASPPKPPVPPPPPPLEDHKPPLPVVEARTNINELAREVAAVLSQGQLEVRGISRDASSGSSPNRVESPAPPRYRATIQ
ncbi:hypothetical protein H0H87_005303 [Tephrocybe sp. NHM501043]|nr:hypothetical protein H0H87_005303 [Tephrocybe sp. NHM501043]